ncbi:CBS domain-containing protein / transporter associated domain-containing protein [Perilla frutescens var. frutescens]|nr:CBS domain-containing protein / transporter associated domain-containing protein [Perilla frutescens var. frutescens]
MAAAAAASEATLFNRSAFISGSNRSFILRRSPLLKLSPKFPARKLRCCTCCSPPYNSPILLFNSNRRSPFPLLSVRASCCAHDDVNSPAAREMDFGEVLVRRGLAIAAAAAIGAVVILSCRRALAVEGVLGAGYGVWERSLVSMRSSWPKVLQVLTVFKEQGLILAALLGLSAFFSMAETSITTLWPWKVRELAEKESENGVFKLLRNDVTRFLTTILIGTTVVNIGATALVTEAATAIFGEAGVSAATGVMTVAILLLTEITPKSIAVHNATEVARFVVRPVAWLSLVLYPVGRVVTYLSMGMLKLLGLKGKSEPYVTEDELKLMLRGAELSGAIEEEEQDMIENVLEIKDTHVREVMTPLVDVVAIDAGATLVDFHNQWVDHQYSRVPVFEERIDNIVGIAYAMDLLDFVQKGELLESSKVGDMAHKPAYFVPDSMSVWNLLREFRIRKVHMAVVLNEYGGTVGIVTLEDVVEEIVGEIFDENDSKEEIQKKTGYIVMRAEGIYDVDANTSIDQLSEDLNIKMPEGHQYETVSGFVCEAFGYIPRTGETIKIVLEREHQEDNGDYDVPESDRQDENEKTQIFKLEILAGNARKVSAVRFERINNDEASVESRGVTRFLPKLWRRRSNNSDDESDRTEGDEVPAHEKSNDYVMSVQEDNTDQFSDMTRRPRLDSGRRKHVFAEDTSDKRIAAVMVRVRWAVRCD